MTLAKNDQTHAVVGNVIELLAKQSNLKWKRYKEKVIRYKEKMTTLVVEFAE